MQQSFASLLYKLYLNLKFRQTQTSKKTHKHKIKKRALCMLEIQNKLYSFFFPPPWKDKTTVSKYTGEN